jgi:hypothetical protein
MTATFKNLAYKLSSSLSSSSVATLKNDDGSFSKAKKTGDLFPTTDPTVDGDDCLHDCATCTIKYPRKFEIDETEELYGHVKGWQTHLVVATGKTDWVRDVADEKGSIMEAVDRGSVKPSNGKLMLSASDMPVPDHSDTSSRVLLLPSWQFIDNVSPANVPELITNYVNQSPTNDSPLHPHPASGSHPKPATATATATETETHSASSTAPASTAPSAASTPPPTLPPSSALTARPCPHKYLILLCSQKTRDARCGQSAPLLRREFERHLRPLGLYRDLHDERPGGVGIYFISHVGGHKFSANVMVYRHSSAVEADGHADGAVREQLAELKVDADKDRDGVIEPEAQAAESRGEAAQCIWLARVRPEDCENIIRYTVLQGKLVKPERQLRGGFDRSKQLASW